MHQQLAVDAKHVQQANVRTAHGLELLFTERELVEQRVALDVEPPTRVPIAVQLIDQFLYAVQAHRDALEASSARLTLPGLRC